MNFKLKMTTKNKSQKCKAADQVILIHQTSFSLNGKTAFSINSSTVVLYVPADRTQREKYAKKTASSAFTTGDTYYVEAYDISSSKVAGLLVLYGNDGTLTSVKKDTNFSIVSTLPESVYNEVKDDSVFNSTYSQVQTQKKPGQLMTVQNLQTRKSVTLSNSLMTAISLHKDV